MVYHVAFTRIIKRPLNKVFAWCTDFEPEDARFKPERKAIRIVSKEVTNVVFEGEGYDGARFVARVKLFPPNRWEATYNGDLFDEQIIYSLEETPEGNTKFNFSCEGTHKGRKSSLTQEDSQKETEAFWDRLISALEAEVRL